MKPVYVSLGVGQEFNLAGLVKKIKVRQAIGPVILKTERETAPADLGETITFEQASNQVQVINEHDAANTLELIVISSEEGALDAAASSVAITNAAELKANTPLLSVPKNEFFDKYRHTNGQIIYKTGIVSPGNTEYIAGSSFNGWLERVKLEVVSGEFAVLEMPWDTEYIGNNESQVGSNPLLPSAVDFQKIPRYYEGERLHYDYSDRLDLLYVHNTGAEPAEYRAMWYRYFNR